MDFLRRELAPIPMEAWAEIDEQATRSLTAMLSGRRVLDVTGPMGTDFPGVPEGRLDYPKKQAKGGLKYGIRKVHHIVEVRVPFELEIAELDNVVRGARDVDLSALEDAAKEVALFEEKVIYHGLPEANITGLYLCQGEECLTIGSKPEQLLEGIAGGVTEFSGRSIEGPYSFIVGPKLWSRMSSHIQGYPVKMQAEAVLGGQVLLSSYLSGEHENQAFMMSQRGGDFELILGQDLAIGYESHTAGKVRLYFTESFTFRVFEPSAVLNFTARK
ncbi:MULTISPECIES: family 1 encapsulin nanocompartment shell protein [Desulfosediminicola]|uniref:family 1 encapsulin nanocompartment shell protein n=1 Tax=Desulfosediminicola TaxID=2886823 RepID=UPI0010AD5CE7|nr:family 1 encapsulin nanocompartment shell protein [Desulfosediminicola ganghwensis]